MRSNPILTPLQEIQVFREYRVVADLLEGLPTHSLIEHEQELQTLAQIKDRLIRSNLGLVYQVVQRYGYGQGHDIEDLVQEGCIGLQKAVERFDPTKGYRFATYAVWWIRRWVCEAVRKNALIATSARVKAKAKNDPSFQIYLKRPISLDAISGDQVRETLLSKVSVAESGEAYCLSEELKQLLNELRSPYREVIELRYGLSESGRVLNFREIAEALGLNRETVRRYHNSGIKNLQKQYGLTLRVCA